MTENPYTDILKSIVQMTLLIPEDAFAGLMTMDRFDTIMPFLDPTQYREGRHKNEASNMIVKGLQRFQADLKKAQQIAEEGQKKAEAWQRERSFLSEFLS